MERVAIIGVGQTKYEREKNDTFSEMVYEVVTKALDDAGMVREDIDNIVTVSNDFWDGRTISSMAVVESAGSWGRDVTTVEADGAFGAILGLARTLSGSFDTTLVVAHSKVSEGSPSIITNAAFDPIYERMLGLDGISSAGLQARRYMTKYGITEEQCAKVSVKNHKNAKNNPYAQLPLDITVEDVLNSRMLADPIKLLDTSPISDGACAIILATEREAKRRVPRPVWVKGVGHCTDAYHPGDRDLAEVDSLIAAAKRAYEMAGITNPLQEISVAEVYDAFSYTELMWMEGLGFCERGEAGSMIDAGATEMDGILPVNPSGGILSAHPVIAGGLIRIAEAALQVRGGAGDRQVPNVEVALAHGINGMLGQAHCVWILGR
jgi:acetyl-CoA C-acetyltransferase